MISLQTIEATVIRDTLLSFTQVTDLVALEGVAGQYKIFHEDVPAEIKLPYITIHHIFGGYANDAQTQDSDSTWKVIGVSSSVAIARQLGDAVSNLHRAMPVITAYASTVAAYVYIEELVPVSDRYVVQNVPLLMRGGLYRLRLVF